MMYRKKLAEIVITTVDGAVFSVADTIECPVASSALASIQNGKGAFIQVGDDTYFVPSSAVSNVKVSYTDSEEIEKTDPCGNREDK